MSYPGETIKIEDVRRDDALGCIRIQDWRSMHNGRVDLTALGLYLVGSYLPGVEQCSPGDTPKVWPEKSKWCSDWNEAERLFRRYVREAHDQGWQSTQPERLIASKTNA